MVEDKPYWTKVIYTILKMEMAKQSINYIQLVKRLDKIGVKIGVEDLRTRFYQGTFSARLFVQCLKAMEVKNLPWEELFDEKTAI
jgi:hypothetical protein